MPENFDVVVIGAGAAGMMCAAVAGQRGRRVLLMDHSKKIGEKIRISGGGRCNFTNTGATALNYLSDNPHFCKSALARYTPADFIALVKRHRIGFHEKHKGQLFCNDSAEQIIAMLQTECNTAQVQWRTGCSLSAEDIQTTSTGYLLQTSAGEFHAQSIVVACGGLSIPKIGATDLAYRIARQFEIGLIATSPALVPLTFSPQVWERYAELSGVALPVSISVQPTVGTARKNAGKTASKNTGNMRFDEDMLFTHRGLSGPALLQISSYWPLGTPLLIDLLPGADLAGELLSHKAEGKKSVATVLAHRLPARLIPLLLSGLSLPPDKKLADMSDKAVLALAQTIQQWQLQPDGTEGYRKAEVTKGGVDTRALSQQTMMCDKQPGLYFIGEAVDVTGWLGGYNFQWAWSSGVAAGLAA